MDPLETTRDLERVANQALASLDACNVDKAKLKTWSEKE